MKRLIIVLVVVFGFVSLGWGEPRTVKVEVVNDPLNVEVVAEPSTSRDVNVTNTDPIPVVGEVAIVEPARKEIVSVFFEFSVSDGEEQNFTIVTVGTDEKFVLTDIVSSPTNLSILENDNLRFKEWTAAPLLPLRLSSGIGFDSGSEVIARVKAPTYGTLSGVILVSGYLIDN